MSYLKHVSDLLRRNSHIPNTITIYNQARVLFSRRFIGAAQTVSSSSVWVDGFTPAVIPRLEPIWNFSGKGSRFQIR